MIVKYKHKDCTKDLIVTKDIELGELQSKILGKCNLLSYEIKYLIIVYDNGNNLIIGDNNTFFSKLNEHLNINYIEVIPRTKDESGKFTNNQYFNKYLEYLRIKDDERIAMSIQNGEFDEDSHFPPHLENILNEGLENNDIIHNTMNYFGRLLALHGSTDFSPLNTPVENQNEDQEAEQEDEQVTGELISMTTSDNQIIENPNPIRNESSESFGRTINHQNAVNFMNLIGIFDTPGESSEDRPLRRLFYIQNFQQGQMQPTHGLFNFLNQLANNNFSDVKIVSTKDEILAMKENIKKYGDIKNEKFIKSNQCNICLEYYQDNEEILLLKCNHYYHKDCIVNWISNESNKCPICKEKVSEGKAVNL